MTGFDHLGLPAALLQTLQQRGYAQPTPVQSEALPVLLQGRDAVVQARTGSGKTAAFGLALLARRTPGDTRLRTLVLCPTRELADQVANEIRSLAAGIPNIKVLGLCGGIPVRPQLASLAHEPQIVVGTPGRIQDLLKRQALALDAIDCVVLDEADRMLDMGFVDAIRRILAQTPRTRRTWLFSATYPATVGRVSDELQRDPAHIVVDTGDTAPDIEQGFIRAEPDRKPEQLAALLLDESAESCLVFVHTRLDADRVADELRSREFAALALHGDMDQRDREEALVQFANGSCRVLVATDVAARGLDIQDLPLVVSWELPKDPDVHVHRVGRTGRAGASGRAVALVSAREQSRLTAIEARTGVPVRWIEPSPPAQARPQPPRMKTLVIDAGRRDKLRAGDILGALTGVGGLSGGEVGRIELFATRAYVGIALPRYRATLTAMRSARIKNRKFRVRGL